MNKVLLFLSPFIFVIFALFFIIKFVPPATLRRTLPESHFQEAMIICTYPLRVMGNSMMPAIKNGTLLIMNKCLEDVENIPAGKIVAYKTKEFVKIGRIRALQQDKFGKIYYKISPDAKPLEIKDVYPEDILAFYQESLF